MYPVGCCECVGEMGKAWEPTGLWQSQQTTSLPCTLAPHGLTSHTCTNAYTYTYICIIIITTTIPSPPPPLSNGEANRKRVLKRVRGSEREREREREIEKDEYEKKESLSRNCKLLSPSGLLLS
jgi:hypothetical protein